ncbi:hypothetical protein [Streptomyces sp. NRRL B-24484]|uniref:hypothetical protein n=1 Tax=Streptomyces sp. NRRL B-24484 TaxID=1463833 RepID=UPI000B2CE3C4|nr:hypothetical protein [Streptomyces sp. NRRL B-24484]
MSANALPDTPNPAEIVGAAAPVIAVALGALPIGAFTPGRITFSFIRSGVVATVRSADIGPLFLQEIAAVLTETFVSAGWGHGGWERNGSSAAIRFRHPSTLTRTDIPTG